MGIIRAMPSSFFTKLQLNNWYLKEGLSTYQISEICGCNPKTAYYWLKLFQIPTRPRKIIQSSKKLIQSLYDQGNSMASIGKKLGCTSAAILRKMKKYKIKPRSSWEANIIHKRTNFSGILTEKAYLIGFRIGDLNTKNSRNFVKIKSSTTKNEQLQLMKQLFTKYGPVWIGKNLYKNRVVYNFATSLNKSFNFLIPKLKNIPRWIMKNNEYFYSFFAGYCDAEGSIGIYNNMAKLRVGSYDKTLLKQAHKKLLSLGIKNTFILETRAGIQTNGAKHNGNFWRIGVSEKKSLFICLTQLLFYFRHPNRIKMAKLALRNLLSRL